MKRPNTFKRYLKMIRPFDWIIVGGLFIAAFIPYLIFGIHENQQQATASQQVLTAVVTHDGHEVYRKRLTGHTGTSHFTYRDKDGDCLPHKLLIAIKSNKGDSNTGGMVTE